MVRRTANVHAEMLLSYYFNFEDPLSMKKYDQKSAITLEKEIRNILAFYDSKASKSNLQSFKKLLTYVEVLLTES